jgi:mono/diheme cytochrome c family protein
MRKKIIISIAVVFVLFISSLFWNKPAKDSDGKTLFEHNCISCHAIDKGKISSAPNLIDGTLDTRYGTQKNLEAFVSENMPINAPGTLTSEQYKLLSEFIWNLNKN